MSRPMTVGEVGRFGVAGALSALPSPTASLNHGCPDLMPPTTMSIGQRVSVRGLINKPHFNGMQGTIINTLYSQKGRCWVYHVKLDKGGKKLLFKDTNIEVVGGIDAGVEQEELMFEDMDHSNKPVPHPSGYFSSMPAGPHPLKNPLLPQLGMKAPPLTPPPPTLHTPSNHATRRAPGLENVQTRTHRSSTFSSGQIPARATASTFASSPPRNGTASNYAKSLGLGNGAATRPGIPNNRMSRGLSFDAHDATMSSSFRPAYGRFNRAGTVGSVGVALGGVSANMESPRVQALKLQYSKAPDPPSPTAHHRNPSHSRNQTISGATGAYLGALGF